MGFNSNDYKPSAGGGFKILEPGTHKCRIVSLNLESVSYKPDAYFVTIVLEGMPVGEGFVGMLIDRNDPSKGTYEGSIASVRSGNYPYSTYTYNGKEIQRDDQIFNFVQGLAKQMNVLDAMNKANVAADSIEKYVDEVRKYVVDPEVWATFVIGGKEYYTEGYDKANYRLFFPKIKGKKYPFAVEETMENLIIFNVDDHIIKTEKGEAVKPSVTDMPEEQYSIPTMEEPITEGPTNDLPF